MELVDRLRFVPLFQHLSDDHRRMVADLCEEHILAPNTALARQADLGATFFIIEEGEAIIRRIDESGTQKPLGMMRAGDAFGTASLLLGEPRDATVTAVTEMRVWTLRRVDFEALLNAHPDIRRELIIPQDVAQRLNAPRYPWLEPGETVVLYAHRHWLVFAQSISWITVALLLGFLLIFALVSFSGVETSLLVPILIVLLLYGLAWTWFWIDWHNDYFVVTTRRVAHEERVAFIYETRDEAPLDRVQNVNIVRGLWGSVLHFGDVSVQTAADVGEIRFTFVPYPDRVQDTILTQMLRMQATRRAAERRSIREEMATRLGIQLPGARPDDLPSEEGPSAFSAVGRQEVTPGRVARGLSRLADLGLFPRTRIVTPDSVTWRKHWLFLIRRILGPLAVFVICVPVALAGFRGQGWLAELPYVRSIALAGAVVSIFWFWWEQQDWRNDLYTVTKERIVDLEKRPLFSAEQRREASLGMIQNVSLRIPHIVASTFNYGDVVVQTAGRGDFTFRHVPDPRAVQKEIFRRIDVFRQTQREREASRLRADMSEWFSVYDQMRREGMLPPPAEPDELTPSDEETPPET